LREDDRLRVLENRVLRGEWRRLHSEKL